MKKRFSLTGIICFILSLFLFIDNANTNRYKPVLAQDQTVYLSEVKLYEAENEEAARTECVNDGYIFVSKDVNSGTGKKPVYLGYKTTLNEKEAIYEIRILAMDRGYEIKDKASMQQEYMKQQTELAETLEAASIEFVSNFSDESPKAIDAYNGMNMIVVPEEGNQKFGDFLLAGKGTKDFYAKFIVQASSSTLNSIISYLSAGLAPYDKEAEEAGEDNSWAAKVIDSPLWDIIEDDLSEDEEDDLRKQYDDSAQGLHKQFQEFATNVDNALQRYSGKKITAEGSVEEFVEKVETVENDETDSLYIDIYDKLNEYMATDAMPLGEYIFNLGKTTKDAVDLKMIYPIVDSMSYAQCKMTMYSGLVGAASNLSKNERSPQFNDLLAKAKEKLRIMTENDVYSIWLNADPDFENAKVAYTSDAIRKNAAQTALEKDTSNEGHETVERVLKWAGIASSALTVVSFIIGKYALVGLLTIIAKFASVAVATTLSSVIGVLTTVGAVLGQVCMFLGLFILAFTVVYYLCRWIINMIEKSKPKEYTDMPDYVVDAPKTSSGNANIKYKAVRNNKGKIGDLNGYEGQKGWVCMYTTKDTRVGSPIIADSDENIFNIIYGNSEKQNGYSSVNFFGEVSPGNCNTFAKNDDVNGIYIHYHTIKSLNNKMADAPSSTTSPLVGKQYYGDIIVRTGKTEAEAKDRISVKGYYILDRNLTPSPSTTGSAHYFSDDETYYTYIGYQLTTDPNDAIRDIRVATFLPDAAPNFGDISYGCAGVIGYKANTSEEDEDCPGNLTGLYVTKSAKAGTPIEEGKLHIVTDYSEAKAGWEPVTTFSGAPYDFNTVYISSGFFSTIGVRMYNNSNSWSHTKTLIYFEPEVKYTSGAKYLSGIYFLHGFDTDLSSGSYPIKLKSYMSDFVNEVKKVPNTEIISDNLASSSRANDHDTHSSQKYMYICYTYSYNPYRALYDMAIYQTSPYVETLPYTLSKASTYSDKKAGSAEANINYVAASVLAHQGVGGNFASRGYLPQNAYINQRLLTTELFDDIHTRDLPEGIDFGYKMLNLLPTGLYVAGYTNGKNPLTLDDVIISSNSHSGKLEDNTITFDVSGEKTLNGQECTGDFVSIQEMKNPYSLKAYNIAYSDIYYDDDDDDVWKASTTKYIYLRKEIIKGKYISRVFVGSYCKEDYTPTSQKKADDEYEELSKSTDHQAMMTASQAGSGEVIVYNMGITKEYQWTNYSNKDGISKLEPANKYQYASYISVARTDKEQDAVTGLLLFKSNEKAVPEQIQIQGMTYYCASNTTPLRIVKNDKDGNDPKKDKMEYESYYLYYTYNKGATPGKPLTELSISSDPFTSGQATVLCCDKEDVVTYEGGKKVITEPAEMYGNGNLNAFIHTAYEHGNNTYFNKLYIAEGNSRKAAMLSLLEQGCTEYCDMDLNVDSGGRYVYFGYRGYTIDYDKVKMQATESAREAELKKQQQGAVYDIVCTIGEPFHPEGINSERYQMHYAPVSSVNLNAGTQGPEIYMYYTSTAVATSYNSKIGPDSSQIQSNDPADIFTAPVTKIAFARYDRVPYLKDASVEGDGESNIYRWEYIMSIDFRTVIDFNAGIVKFDDDHVPTDNRITAFIQREDGSAKSWGEITGGFVSESMTVGTIHRVTGNGNTSSSRVQTSTQYHINLFDNFGGYRSYEDMCHGRINDFNIYLNGGDRFIDIKKRSSKMASF